MTRTGHAFTKGSAVGAGEVRTDEKRVDVGVWVLEADDEAYPRLPLLCTGSPASNGIDSHASAPILESTGFDRAGGESRL